MLITNHSKLKDTKSDSSHQTVKLSFLILICITEDQYANALINDPNLVFKVKLHRAPMRHRKPQSSWDSTNAQSKSLACSVMDLMVRLHFMLVQYRNFNSIENIERNQSAQMLN